MPCFEIKRIYSWQFLVPVDLSLIQNERWCVDIATAEQNMCNERFEHLISVNEGL
jgi:hypothetical protein